MDSKGNRIMNVLAPPRLTALMLLTPLLFSPVSIPAQGTVFPHNVVLSPAFGAMPPGSYITQIQYPGSAGLFAISVNTIGVGDYRFEYYGIAELYSVHAATFGLEFTPAFVIGDTPLLNNNNNPGQFTISLAEGESRLFAYWDDAYYGFIPGPGTMGVPDAYDAYGWFRLTRSTSGLEISDSATAIGGGIRVGTYTVIPEPTCFPLCSVALLGLLARKLNEWLALHKVTRHHEMMRIVLARQKIERGSIPASRSASMPT